VQAVILGGRLYTRSALDAMLAKAQGLAAGMGRKNERVDPGQLQKREGDCPSLLVEGCLLFRGVAILKSAGGSKRDRGGSFNCTLVS